MSSHTQINLNDVENQAPNFGFPDDMEARFASSELGLEHSGAGILRLKPGFRLPFGHKHSEQEEHYLVISGSARVKLDDDIVDMRTWDVVRIPRDTMRALEGGPEGAEVLAFGAPDTDNKDVEMVQGWWSD